MTVSPPVAIAAAIAIPWSIAAVKITRLGLAHRRAIRKNQGGPS